MENRIVISRSEKYRNIDRRYLWHPYSSHSAIQKNNFPVIVRGKGLYLFDCDGKQYFDAISSWWCCNLGHSHPRIVAAIKNQAGKLQHSILGNMSHPPAIKLAERLAGLFPDNSRAARDKNRRVFFSSDGSSAVEAALKISVQYWHNIGKPERRRIVSLENAYHGDTLGSVSAGFLPQFHRPFKPLTFPVFRAKAPFCIDCVWHRHPLAGQACKCECFQSMQTVIEKHHNDIAAVIIEPLCQCAAGMRIYPTAYLKLLAQLCRSYKILLIVDEIAVGFGRTGRMFAFERAGIDPDIVCLGKGLTGGYLPLSATIVKENIYATFSDSPQDHTFYHGHTFAGNPIACAAAIEVLKIYKEKNIVSSAARKSKIMANLISRLNAIEGVRNARSLGMIGAFDLDQTAKAAAVKKTLLKAGVLIRPLGNTIYLMPPLITPDNLLADTISLLAETLESTAR